MGAVFKRVRGVRAFARLIAWLLGIQIVLSVLYIIAILVEPKSEFIKQCENGSTDANVVDTCTNKITEVKAITVGIIVVALLLHSCEYLIRLIRKTFYSYCCYSVI
jgi:Na+-transporting methylmalonyl-CoA/oxaloacetate decarboxylase gamma subunit